MWVGFGYFFFPNEFSFALVDLNFFYGEYLEEMVVRLKIRTRIRGMKEEIKILFSIGKF